MARRNAQGPTASLRVWLNAQCSSRIPGSPMPPDHELARTWGLSLRTVQRVMKRYADAGRVVRVRGKGTFLPGGIHAEPRDRPPSRAAEGIAEHIRRAICRGALCRGEALPSVKHMALQFGVSRSAVTDAYRLLRNSELVVKVGRQFWVGRFDSLIRFSMRKTVLFVDWRDHRRSHRAIDELMDLTYRSLERELHLNGFFLHHVPRDQGPRLDRTRSEGQSNREPYGIVLFGALDDGERREWIDRFHRLCHHRQVPLVVAGWGDKPRSSGPRMVSFGNMQTTRARTCARYLTEHRYKNVVLYFDEAASSFGWLSAFMRVGSELTNLDPAARFSVMVKADTRRTATTFFQRLHVNPDGAAIRQVVSKYRPVDPADMETMFSLVEGVRDALARRRDADMWLCPHDTEAAEALAWAAEQRCAVPEKASIVSLENSPLGARKGIACCVPDYQNIGYILAHAIIGDIPLERTQRGFLRTRSLILERYTARV